MVQVHLKKVDKEIAREALKEVLKQALEDHTAKLLNNDGVHEVKKPFTCELCEYARSLIRCLPSLNIKIFLTIPGLLKFFDCCHNWWIMIMHQKLE